MIAGPLTLALTIDDFWTMAIGSCCAAACAIPGCYLVLRRMSLLGDAISHAILPGLAIAFIITESRAVGPMLLGALAAALLTAVLTAALSRFGRVPEDASMGVVFSSLFALGVILINHVAHSIDLDPGCVLYGSIETAPKDLLTTPLGDVPRTLIWLGSAALLNAALVTAFYKELKIVAFDPYLATTLGISAALVHYALMAVVAATTVVSFEAVGSILVVAMLIAPPATAHLLTDRLARMLVLAVILGASAAVLGYLLAAYVWNTSVAGMISVVAGAQFSLAALFSPRYGFFGKVAHRAALSLRVRRQDILGLLYRSQERPEAHAWPIRASTSLDPAGRSWLTRLALASLLRRGLVLRRATGELTLSPEGQAAAQSIIRSHRLWESYLARHLGLPPDHLHEASERMEHFITPAMQDRLAGEFPSEPDPHGRPIPPGPARPA